jgi:PAS domain S-box-containing protein
MDSLIHNSNTSGKGNSMQDQPLRALMIDDSEDDILLTVRELKKGGYHLIYERIETAVDMKKALREKEWDIILCDYKMPTFDAPSAIAIFKELNLNIPFIVISGTIGEDTAIECMRSGAHDYFMKGKLSRLCPAIARELEDAKVRMKQKQSEEELRQSEAKYRTILEDIQEGYFEVDATGNFIFLNDSTCQLLGYSQEELLGMNYRQYTDPENAKKIFQAFRKVYNAGQTSEGFDWQIIRKNGTRRYVEASVSLQKNSQDKAIVFRGLVRDVTERKLAEVKLQQTLDSLKNAVGATIQVLIAALEARDPYTAGHQSQSARLASAIATEMGLAQESVEGIRMAGSIHDLGKLSIPAEILTKPSRLTVIEYEMVKEHPQSGYDMLKDIESPWPLAQIVYQHHERMNGTGYPRMLKGDEIILEARIMAVADVVDAMSSHRPYRASLGIEAALKEIEQNRGTLYDETVVDACLSLIRNKDYKHT